MGCSAHCLSMSWSLRWRFLFFSTKGTTSSLSSGLSRQSCCMELKALFMDFSRDLASAKWNSRTCLAMLRYLP